MLNKYNTDIKTAKKTSEFHIELDKKFIVKHEESELISRYTA